MGTHFLQRYDTADVYDFFSRLGYTSELDFWQSMSGNSTGTMLDHMVSFLSSLGYGGNPSDQFRQFVKDQAAIVGAATIFDLINKYVQGSVAGATFLQTEDGEVLSFEDGTPFELE